MHLAFRIVVVQCLVAGVLALLWSVASLTQGVSSALGAGTVLIPNAYFAWRVGVSRGDANGIDEARRLVGNSVVKLVLGVALLVAVFATYRPEPTAFFATLVLVQAVHWVSPWMGGAPRRRVRKREDVKSRKISS